MKRIKRKIVKVENYIDPHANGTGGSNILTLECGHYTTRKASQGVPEFSYCVRCENWASGRTVSRSEGDIVETWDAEKQMPIFSRKPPAAP